MRMQVLDVMDVQTKYRQTMLESERVVYTMTRQDRDVKCGGHMTRE